MGSDVDDDFLWVKLVHHHHHHQMVVWHSKQAIYREIDLICMWWCGIVFEFFSNLKKKKFKY